MAIGACSAVLNFAFSTETCGTFSIQLQNLSTGAFTYYDPATSPLHLTGLKPCTEYTVGISHITDECASAPLKLNFATECKKCKDCNLPCKEPDYAYMGTINATYATVNFGFVGKTCGFFVAQLRNNATGTYTYIDPVTSPLLQLTNLDPCTSYTIGLSHVTDRCASVPLTLTFTTDCPGYCDVEGLDASCLYNHFIGLTTDWNQNIFTYDNSVGYIDATQNSGGTAVFIAPGTVLSVTNTNNCYCVALGGPIYLKLWIDYNQDFSFSTNELVYAQNTPVSTFGGPVNCSTMPTPGFTFPNIAACGLTARYIVSTDPDAGPCGTFAIGQAVDFTIDSAICL